MERGKSSVYMGVCWGAGGVGVVMNDDRMANHSGKGREVEGGAKKIVSSCQFHTHCFYT